MVATGQRAGTVMQAPSNDNSIDALAMASDRSHASGLMNTQAEPCLADVTQAVAGVVRIVELMLARGMGGTLRSEEHTSELQSLMRNSYAVSCLHKKETHTH